MLLKMCCRMGTLGGLRLKSEILITFDILWLQRLGSAPETETVKGYH